MKSWVQEISSICEKDLVYVIAGNKMDLVQSISNEEAEQFAKSIHGEYIETYAKTGANLDLLLRTVAQGEYERTL